jgi:TRAP-type C4-dicarboxylate transport system substrate-binding protein
MNASTFNRRHVLAAAAAAAASTVALTGPAWAQSPIVIKFSHVVANDTPKGNAADFFAKRAAELTKGKVEVTEYKGTLGKGERQLYEALQLGTLEGAIASTGISNTAFQLFFFAAFAFSVLSNQNPISRYEHNPTPSQPKYMSRRFWARTSMSMKNTNRFI